MSTLTIKLLRWCSQDHGYGWKISTPHKELVPISIHQDCLGLRFRELPTLLSTKHKY
jgi:hypothetical protein